ncbi:MAG: T9SS type A sorting domain-containing protein [Flavobacteriales bacterium]|nr:T9SS type A sorting domain-containing protein [Flavobacteriales bacterium]
MRFLLFLLIFPYYLFSQTGPGGIGIRDGSSNLKVWYPSIPNTTSFSHPFTTWSDFSGNGLDIAQPNIFIPTITYFSNALNGHGIVRFSAANTVSLSTVNSALLQGKNNYTIFIVGYANAANQKFLEYDDVATDGMTIRSTAPNSIEVVHNSSASVGVDGFYGFDGERSNATAQIITVLRSTTGYKKIINQGSYSGSGVPTELPLTSAGVLQLGGASGGNTFIGDVAEVIIFDRELTDLEKMIIENYLSAKFNIPILKADYYDEDDPGNGDYDFDVAGIGRFDATEIHGNSQGTGVFTMLNPQDLDDNEYCIWGHDGQILFPTEIVDIPATITSRSNRVWRASEVDDSGNPVDVGAVDIRFDLTGVSINTSQLRLLVDTDNDGVFADETPITGATLVGGNVYQFAGVTALQNNLRFTAGFVGQPLPIELIDFDATINKNNTIQLNWQTATEINNDYFTVERSVDAIFFEPIKKINGAGNSNTMLAYFTVDNLEKLNSTNFHTIYYRLKQTDFDGKFSYSKIESVNLNSTNQPSVAIYPNPTINQITIKATEEELEQILLFNFLGENITDKVVFIRNTKVITANLNSLKKGVFYLKTKTVITKFIKQ